MTDTDLNTEAALCCMIVSNPGGGERPHAWQKRVNDLIRSQRDEIARLRANTAPATLLFAYDRFMSGVPIEPEIKRVAYAVARAACFGAAAYEKALDADQGAHALARSFLLALTDPVHPDLDYLRATPIDRGSAQ